jgi:hypothetical protein
MWTWAFWKATAERVIATFAAAFGGLLLTALADPDWLEILRASGIIAAITLAKCLAASKVGTQGPSLANETITTVQDEPH